MPRCTTILIVENDERRLDAMRAVCETHLPNATIVDFSNAPHAIDWLEGHFDTVSLISLDFDLGTDEELADPNFDVGNGGDVARWLAKQQQFCPAILHTDNFFSRPTMQKALDEGGWKHTYVAPGNETSWVSRSWLPMVLQSLSIG